MTKTFIALIITSFINSSFSQNNTDDIIPYKRSFSIKKNELDKNEEKILIDNDTLYVNQSLHYNLSHLNSGSYSREKILTLYRSLVFHNSNEKTKNAVYLKQWNDDITICIDKKLPKQVIKDFKTFFSDINKYNIDNLNISFTNNIEKANFYIKTTSKIINEEDYKFDSEEVKDKSLLYGATYDLTTDKNNKFYNGILLVNPSQSNSESRLLRQLKQLFYSSLGNFCINSYIDESSLLYKNCTNLKTISQLDIDLLRIHYGIIYDQKISRGIFKKLIKQSKK